MKTNWQQDWTVFLGITIFIVTALLALAQPYGIIPAYLQTGGQGRSSHCRGITGVVNKEKLRPENARLEYNKNTGVLLIRTTERAIPVDSFGKIQNQLFF
jgi:hypothetical protein